MSKLNDVQATKHRIITDILSNPTYTPESGVWCRLYNRLSTMSKDDLAALRMIVDLKAAHVMSSPKA